MAMLSPDYSDKIIYREEVVEVAWRRGSIELNTAKSTVQGIRVYRNGYWSIVSVQGDNADWDILEKMAEKLLGSTGSEDTGKRILLGRECNGSFKLGSRYDVNDLVELVKYIAERIGGGEVILLAQTSTREIIGETSHCLEEKTVYEIDVYIEKIVDGYRSIGSSGIAYTGELGEAWRIVDNLIEDAVRRAEANLRTRKLGVLETGKWTIILGYEASGAFFHELAHLLEGDQPGHLRIGERISTSDINVYDDPLCPWSPATRRFDDEAVESMKKPLVGDGEVVGLLHTRESAADAVLGGHNALPGQARGLFHKPKAMHTTLVIEPGDWKVKELIEESKKTILVDGIIRAELYGQTVTIIPETAWLVDRELREPVRIRAIRLPLIKALTTIDAMTRTSRLRYSYEKGHIVAEIAPMTRLQGVVEA